jgi:hypothetical protein
MAETPVVTICFSLARVLFAGHCPPLRDATCLPPVPTLLTNLLGPGTRADTMGQNVALVLRGIAPRLTEASTTTKAEGARLSTTVHNSPIIEMDFANPLLDANLHVAQKRCWIGR